MTRASWILALIMVLSLCGVASAQTSPVAPAAQPVTVAAPAVVLPAATTSGAAGAAAPSVDLSQIFAAPSTTGISTVPEPKFASCTLAQCRHKCQMLGCFSDCIDLATCTCEAICG